MLDSARWEKIAALYDAACEREPRDRRAFLDEACAGDADLRQRLELLLRQDVDQDGVLEDVARQARQGNPAVPAVRSLPESIGAYRILGLLGEGGMGAVYEAEQQNPRRTVALKVVKPGLTAPKLLRRFDREAKALARLQHPGIARIYEAGVADTGAGRQPYFAMELVHGLPLTDYASSRQLPTGQKLELMIKVCEAVHHAHQRGIIHRDLKPSNILVDEAGQPRILDFGVAHIGEGDSHATRQTSLGEVVGTLAYMSPEQVLGDPAELDARSDVYALGVLLYELLAGRLPYETGQRPYDAARVIREIEAAPLSEISRVFRGDIDTITLKALEKNKTRRYALAADLADDLQRYLANQPIQARRPSLTYQARKFTVRHKTLVLTTAVVFVALSGGVLVSVREAIRAGSAERAALRDRDRATAAERRVADELNRTLRAERAATSERNRAVAETQRADREAAAARAVNDFLQNDLLAQAGASAQAGPNSKPDPNLTVRTALDRAAQRIAGKFDNQPSVEASIRHTIGIAYRDLGFYTQAEQQLERAQELYRRSLGPEHRDTLTSMQDLASVYQSQAKFGQAETLLTTLLEARRRVLGERHPETLAAMNDLALLLADNGREFKRAAAMFAQVLEVQRKVLRDGDPYMLAVMNNLATQYVNLGKYGEAEDLIRKVVESKKRVLGDRHPSTLLSENTWGVILRYTGKYQQAEQLLTTVTEARRESLGDEHMDTLASANSLALLYAAEGKYTDAEALLLQTAEVRRRALGEKHPQTFAALNNLAEVYEKENRLDDAEKLFASIVEGRRKTLAPGNTRTAQAMASLGRVKLRQQQYAQAEQLLGEALRVYRAAGEENWQRYYAESTLGAALLGSGKYSEAEPHLLAGHRGMAALQEATPFEERGRLNEVRQWIVKMYERAGTPKKAADWR